MNEKPNENSINKKICLEMASNFTKDIETALAANHRRMYVLAGNDYNKKQDLTLALLDVLAKQSHHDLKGYLVLVYDDVDTMGQQFKDKIKNSFIQGNYTISLKLSSYRESLKLLGQTFDFIILDLTKNLHPDDLGRLIETVRGGGIVILWAPPFEDWPTTKLSIHNVMVSPPYTINDIKHRYLIRFIKKLFEHNGISLIDADELRIIKQNEPKSVEPYVRQNPELPDVHVFPLEIYELAVTQDQVEAVKTCEFFVTTKQTKKQSVIITADRGRGKTVSLGLALAGLAYVMHNEHNLRPHFLITSPRYENILPLIDFYKLALDRLGISYEEVKDESNYIVEIKSSIGRLTYDNPLNCTKRKPDLLVVDEAAGLPVHLLYTFVNKNDRTIFSSTIHGYEGAGRSFSIRFLSYLGKMRDLEYVNYKLSEPIRYAPDDPIEKWLYDTLFLDAEPVSLTDEDIQDISRFNVTLAKKDLDLWFSGKNEEEAKQFIGIYVYAHYRNRPRDIAFLADAPHHSAYALQTSSGAIVTAIQVAEEGNMPKDVINAIYKHRKDFHGQIVPHTMIVHQRMPSFATLKGLRIVRIATHPDVMRKGLGSFALNELSRIAKKEGYTYLSAIFGANSELLHFWIKNGFIPVHVSPDRNPISGEYSVAVIKPLTKKLQNMIVEANNELRVRVLGWLPEQLKDMNTRVAFRLLHSFDTKRRFYVRPPDITIRQWEKLHGYALELMTYEAVADALRNLCKLYIMDASPAKPKLNVKQIDLIIAKCLQIRDWKSTAESINATIKWCFIELIHIVRRLLKFYTTPEIWKRIGVHYQKAKPTGIEEKPEESESPGE